MAKIVVIVDKGEVVNIMSDEPVEAVVVDYEAGGLSDLDIGEQSYTMIPQGQEQSDRPAYAGEVTPEINPQRVAELYEVVKTPRT